MRVKLLTSRVEASGHAQAWGDVIDVLDVEARRLIESGQAMPMPAAIETGMKTQTARGAIPQRATREVMSNG